MDVILRQMISFVIMLEDGTETLRMAKVLSFISLTVSVNSVDLSKMTNSTATAL
jgi:hypothetical protein